MPDTLHFLPWLRTGLASLYEGEGVENNALSIGMSLMANRAVGAGSERHEFADHSLQILGPGAVVGLQSDEVLRREPKPGATGVEPNYFAALELKSADLPWRYTPGGPDQDGKLTPWLALVVVEKRAGVTLNQASEGRLQSLQIDEADRELPPLEDAWSWAHVQYQGTLRGSDADVALTVQAAFDSQSADLRARLICPRRLDPGKTYAACVVPTFRAGQLAGQGAPGSGDLGPAWPEDNSPVTLPVYMSWDFTTGPRGDFEALVKRLTPREMAARVGLRPLDLTEAGSGLNGEDIQAYYAGALVSPAALDILNETASAPTESEHGFSEALASHINAPLARLETAQKADSDPVVAPPAYGRSYRPEAKLKSGKDATGWFDRLNTTPQNRVVAGVAADLVRKNQEELMDMAWDAAREIDRANMHLNVAQISKEVGGIARQRFSQMKDETRMRVSAPAFNAMSGAGSDPTVNAQLHRSAIPNGLFASGMRRMTRPQTGLTSEAGTADPGGAVVAAFLANPLGEIGAYRDDLSPVGLTGEITPAPQYVDAASSNTLGQVVLRRPVLARRPRRKFSQLEGIDGLLASVRRAQDPEALLGRAMRARVPAIAKAATAVPAKMQIIPNFTQPVYHRLRQTSIEHLVPGIGEIPTETVTILYRNDAFMRAFMVGMNHELAREFVWREYPTPLNATWFRHFWNGAAPDIDPIAQWGAEEALSGGKVAQLSEDEMVLVVRGALPQRYPKLRLYAVPAKWKYVTDSEGVKHWYRDEAGGEEIMLPTMAGQLAEDVFFFGFKLARTAAIGTTDHNAAAGYFFAFEEIPGAARFGLESPAESAPFGAAPMDWQTISWASVTPREDETLAKFVKLRATPWMEDGTARPGNGPDAAVWAQDAAVFARQTLQRPARVLMHASAMLPDLRKMRDE